MALPVDIGNGIDFDNRLSGTNGNVFSEKILLPIGMFDKRFVGTMGNGIGATPYIECIKGTGYSGIRGNAGESQGLNNEDGFTDGTSIRCFFLGGRLPPSCLDTKLLVGLYQLRHTVLLDSNITCVHEL